MGVRAIVSVFLVCVASICFADCKPARFGFNIGTSSTSSDIALNGAVAPEWGDAKNLPASQNLLTIYIWVDQQHLNGTSSDIEYTIDVVPGNSNILSTEIDGANAKSEKEKVSPSSPKELKIHLTCHSEGVASGTVVIQFADPHYQSITFQFNEECVLPKLQVSPSINNNGCPSPSTPGIVRIVNDSHVDSSWSPTVPSSVSTTGFCVWLSSPQGASIPITTEISSSDASVLNSNVSSPRGLTVKNDPILLNVAYHCLSESKQDQDVALYIHFGWDKSVDPIKIAWKKQCSSSSSLPVSTSSSSSVSTSTSTSTSTSSLAEKARVGFMVGSVKGGTDVIRDGKPIAQWAGDGHIFPADITQTTFSVTLLKEGSGFDNSQSFNIASNMDDKLVAIKFDKPGPLRVTTTESVDINISFTCKQSGTHTGSFVFELENFDKITCTYKIPCDKPKLNLSVNNGELIVEKGEVKNSKLEYVANEGDSETKFTVSLAGDSSSDSIQLIPRVSSSKDDIAVSIANNLTVTKQPTSFSVQYTCRVLDAVSTITMTLDDGWIPYQITWDKICGNGGRVDALNPAASSGLGGFSIFIIIVTCLACFACGLSCLYNYFYEHRRGIDIVPGSTYIENILNRGAEYVHAQRQKRKTPQMQDYDRVGMEDDEFGGSSYQTDL